MNVWFKGVPISRMGKEVATMILESRTSLIWNDAERVQSDLLSILGCCKMWSIRNRLAGFVGQFMYRGRELDIRRDSLDNHSSLEITNA